MLVTLINSVMLTLLAVILILHSFGRIHNINRRVESRKKLEHRIQTRREKYEAATGVTPLVLLLLVT